MVRIRGVNINDETVREIGKFAILWNIFEKEKCGCNCSEKELGKVAQRCCVCKDAWQELAHIFKDRVDINSCNTTNYIESKLSLGIGIKDKKSVKDFIESEGLENTLGGLIAIFRIRNNMFHGLKDWATLNLQIELFRGINAFLEEILKV